jgi:peptide/nickel transport system substrate-binding protein
MRHIAFPFPAGNKPPLALAVILLFGVMVGATGSTASTRPSYGGTLHIQINERIPTIDPRLWPADSGEAAAADRIDSLIFDRMIRLDDHGTSEPALAVSWQHDAQSKRWEFRLRNGVKFTDGSPLTPEIAALALQQLLRNSFDVSANSDSVIVQADHSIPDLLEQLATGRYFIFHTTTDGGIFGTGPFQVTDWPSDLATKAVLTANESCWAGRPFVDKIELTMGMSFERQANAIAVGQADVVELPASQVRRAAQRNVRTVSSDPVELFALQFNTGKLEVQDAHLRQAISLAIDRASIADVILQRQGMPAGGLLPNWISGYAHLFPVSADLARAKELLAATGREVSRPAPLVLVYDSGDADARAIAERVAVNLREAGIVAQISGQAGGAKNPTADMQLVRFRMAAPDPGIALAEILNALGGSAASLETPEEDYAAERAPIDAFLVIPLVHVSESYGLSPQVRDWMPPRWGGWRLEDVWLEPAPAAGEKSP